MTRILACLGFLVLPTVAHAASFDCTRATTPDEETVCADPRLSEADTLLGAAYAKARQAPSASPGANEAARDFLAQRRACRADRACILAAYAAVLDAMRPLDSTGLPPWLDALAIAGGAAPGRTALPTAIGGCAMTEVAEVGPRLDFGRPPQDEDFDSGTQVIFGNRGRQVSYGREGALIASWPGDKVVMCLTSIPRACPPGDARGRTYLSTNLRTRQSWLLPDSQHRCGGA